MTQASRGSGFSKEIFIVARYSPPGNVIKKFKQNVGEKRSEAFTTPSSNPSSTKDPSVTSDSLITAEAVTTVLTPALQATTLTAEGMTIKLSGVELCQAHPK